MICSSSNDGSPPRKKLCRITGSHPTEDLSKICSIQWEADKLEVINKELDSLDDTDFFLNPEVKASLRLAHSRRENGFSVGSEHSEFALSTLFARTNDDRIKFGVYFKRQLEPKAQPTVGHTDPDVPPSETHSKPVNFYPEIAQDAKREATVLQQVAELKQQGMWSASRLPKVLEPREKPTWQDCFFSEMLWLSEDFIEERKWKKKMALDLANAARNYLRLRQEWNRRCEVAVEVLRKRNAAYVASMVGEWWRNARKELRALSLSATGKHRRHLLNQNTALLATASDLCPSWMAKVHYNTSSQNCLKRSHQPKDDKFISVGDGETDDSDWAPASCTETSGSDESRSRSTSSSRAVSFIGDTDGDSDGCYLDSRESDIHVPLLSPNRPLIEELNSWKTDEHILHIPSILDSADLDPQDEYLCQLEAKLEAEQQYCKSNQSTPHDEENSFSSVPYSPRFHSSDSTDYTSTDKNILLTQNPDESITDEKHADPCPSEIQTEVDLLNSEALLPLESVLPEDYLSIRDKQLRITTSEPHQILQSSVFSGQDPCLTAMDSSSANGNASFTVPPDGGVLFSLSDNTTAFNRPAAHLTIPPWGPNSSSNLSKCSLVEIQSNALRLFSLLKTLLTDLNTTADVCAAANLPTFRLSTLPLYSIAVVVSWLRHALPLQVPALLLPSNPMSGDAELAVAAHLGQLVIPVGCNPIHSDPETSTVLDSGFGDWGPHLIVTPRLYLPVWRSRLSHWCPGFKVTCLGLGSRTSKTPHEPSGSTRRLRSAVAHGSVNVCLTTYAAVLARPSRYSHIRWSVIILDQFQHILPCTELDQTSIRLSVGLKQPMRDDPSQCQPVSGTQQSSIHTLCYDAINIFVSELQCSGHRILISSAPDLLSSACGFRLFQICRLLLSQTSTESNEYRSWVTEFFETVHLRHGGRMGNQPKDGRPSKRQVLKFLEPFVLRLDEDYEWEACVDEQVVRCPMTSFQRQLHDSAMSTRTARNASKTGDLLDLLKTVSLACRICNHPCLTDIRPKGSTAFSEALSHLTLHQKPCPAPFVFVPPNQPHFGYPGLQYSTPDSVIHAVRHLRDSELSEITLQGFNLMTSLQSPDYIRQRICQLTATEKQLKEVICPKPQTVDIPDVQSPIPVDRSVQSGSRTYFTFDGINGQIDHGSRDSPRSPVLANGLMDASSTHLDFADIPVKPKRSRTMSCLSAGGIPAPSKRLRLDSAESCTQAHDLVLLPKVESPFLNAEMRRHLESEFRCNNISASFRKRRREHSSNASRPPSRPDCTSALVCGGHVQPALSLESSPSIRLESLLEANNRRCQQLVGFPDWCSESILNILDLSSSCSIHDCNSGLSINGCYAVRSLCPDPLRTVASSCLSILPCSRLLCSRSPALAFTPLFVTRCLRHFPCPIPACSHDFEYGAQSSSTSHCPFVCQLSNVVRALYAFTEQARWLSVNNTCFFNRSPYSPEILFTPLSRLFHESGKFFTLNNLLEGFLGARVSKHPRCIFLLAHRISFLTLLDAYLSASSWSSLRRIILPHDYRAVGPESCSSVDEINNWPRGSKGTLFALIHSRSPVSYISGLRAGSDTVVILCDVDWRSDSLDQLRSLLHSWALNGLAASQARGKTDMVTPIIRVYRLVSVGEPGRAILCSSVEASISSGVACRLLPESVFQAHACDSMDRNALFIARVQPNVVNEFLNSRTAWDHRSMSWVTSCKHLGLDRDSILAIKQEAMSCSSPSSVMSSMSYPAADGRRDETPREGEFITFQEREPLSENLFFRALELFEDPDDTQAWCCANAEQVAVAATIFDELIDVDCSDDLDSETEDSVEFIQPSDLFLRDHLLETEEENQLSAPILQELLAYSNEVSWEVACQEAMDSVNQLEIFGTHHGSMLSYNSSASFCLTPRDTSTLPPMDLEFFGYDMCLPHFSDLPIWNPLDALEPTIQAGGNVEPTSTKVHPAVPMVDKDLHTQFSIWKSASDPANGISHLSFGDPDWGYEFEPMPEHELPPITHAPTTHVSSAQIVPHTNGRSSKWTESSLCSMHKSGRRIHLTTSLSSGSRGSFSGPYLKRRRLAGTTGVSARGTTTSSMTAPTITTNVFTITSQPDSQVTTSPSSTASSKASVSDTYLPSSLVCSTQPSTINLPTTGASSVVSTAGGHSSGSGNTVMLTLTTVGNVSTGGSKLHIPKVSYNKEISSSRTNRLRRSNVPTTVGTVASVTPTVGPIAAGVHLLPPQLSKTTSTYTGHTSQLHAGNVSSFPNPIILARYGHTSPGRHHATQVTQRTAVGSPNATAAAGASGMISLVLTPPSPCGMNNTASSGHLHVGKPLEWFPHEEAALYQSILKLQDTNFDAMGSGASNSALSPNFRLAEFFINNFFPVRGFRGARQCLLMHSKMLGIINTAISSLPTGACSFLQANGFIPPENLSTPSTASPTSTSSTHGSTGRKVKSKLKTSASCINLGASAQASGSVGTTALHSKDSSVDSVAAVNRYRNYLAFQYLQSVISSAVASNASSINTAAFECFSSFPPHLAQFLNVVRANDNNQSRFLRKAIKECLFSPPVVHPTQHHRSMASRRQPPGGFAGPQNTSASALTGYHVGGGMQLNFTSPSGSGLFTFPLTPGQSSSPGPYSASAIGHPVHSSTAPALLTHHRHHRHLGYDHPPGTQAGVSTIESTSSGQLPSAGTSSGSYGGPMIQKNPTHVAALQEHNINPDTLITPAMVIKNKEEREARLLTDASSYEPQSVTTTSTVPGSPNFVTVGYVPTSIFPSAAISLQPTSLGTHQHSTDLTSPTVFLSSTSDNVPGSGAASSVSAPLNLTGGHLSISHTGHRGASFVTIVSSNPTMLRRSATFTPISLSSQPILSYTDGASTGGSIISKPSTGTGYFIQQRSQFISANQTLSTSSARGIFTTVATVSLAPSGLPLSSNFGSLAAPLPQILRSRNTLRGAVVQSTIVRTINASTFPSAVTRFTCTNTGLLPGRTTYTVPSISSTVSSVLGSRGGNLTGMRGHPSVFQQIRAVNHPHHHHHHPGTGLGSYSYGGSQLDSDDSRFVPAQLSTPSNSYIAPGSAVSNASTTASFRQSEADPYVQTRFRPHPAP